MPAFIPSFNKMNRSPRRHASPPRKMSRTLSPSPNNCANPEDIISMDAFDEKSDIIYIVRNDGKYDCYDRNNLLQFLRMPESKMAYWVGGDAGGRRGRPDLNAIVYKLPNGWQWITEDSVRLINSDVNVFTIHLFQSNVPIGNVQGGVGVSMLHGQNPQNIYVLSPFDVDDEIMMVVHVAGKNLKSIKTFVVPSIRDVFLDIIEELFFDSARETVDEERLKFLEDIIVDAGYVVFYDEDNKNNTRQMWVNESYFNFNNLRCDFVFDRDPLTGKYALKNKYGNYVKFGSTKGKSIRFEYDALLNILQDFVFKQYEDETDEEYAERININRFF